MTETLSQRCKRLCGGFGENCFVRNQNQISCIADMIINKLSGILAVMEHAASDQSYNVGEFACMALKNVRELIDWVKFLQISHDLRVPGSLAYEAKESEKRREMRYPLPELYRKYIIVEIDIAGSLRQVKLSDFSRHGIQFRCSQRLETGSLTNGVLRSAGSVGREVAFKVRIRHCTSYGGEYIAGGNLEAVSDNTIFDFFKSVHDFIWEAIMKS